MEMGNSITVEEKYSTYWKWTLFGSLILALALFAVYHYLDNVVVANYIRLASFVSFSVTVFAGLKLIEGRRNLKVSINDTSLEIEILKRDKTIQKNTYPLEQIEYISETPSQIFIPVLDLSFSQNGGITYRIKQRDEKSSFYLFHFGGSILSISRDQTDKINSFLTQHNINIITIKT